jgi:FKBP-type peptidyl-prolyl cis-trans isomerase (trigger factor)
VKHEIWEDLLEDATVIKYPQSELDYFYNSYVDQYKYYESYYKNYGYTFASFDEFVVTYLGLEKGADWKAETEKNSKRDVRQNLLSHAIAQQEGIKVTEEDYKAAVKYYTDYYASYGQTMTEEKIVETVGERLINEYALFEKVNKFLVDNCTVSYEDKEK